MSITLSNQFQFQANYEALVSIVTHSSNDFIILGNKSNNASHPCHIFVHSTISRRIIMQHQLETDPLCAIVIHLLHDQKRVLCCAILVSSLHLRIISLDGSTYNIPLLYPANRLFYCEQGVGIQSNSGSIYIITHPLGSLQSVQMPFTSTKDTTADKIAVVAVHEKQGLMCLYDHQHQKIIIAKLTSIYNNFNNDIEASFNFLPSAHMSLGSTGSESELGLPLNNIHNSPPKPMNKMLNTKKQRYSAISSPKNATRPQSPKVMNDKAELSSMLGVPLDVSSRRVRDSISRDSIQLIDHDKIIADSIAKLEILSEFNIDIKADVKDIHVSLSGGHNLVGGLLLHILHQSTKKYFTYTINQDHRSVTALPAIRDVKQVLAVSHVMITVRSSAISYLTSQPSDAVRVPMTLLEYHPIKQHASKKSSSYGWIVGSQRQFVCDAALEHNVALQSSTSSSSNIVLARVEDKLRALQVDDMFSSSPGFVTEKCVCTMITRFLAEDMNPAAEFIAAIFMMVGNEHAKVLPCLLIAAGRMIQPVEQMNISKPLMMVIHDFVSYYANRMAGKDFSNIIIEVISTLREELKVSAGYDEASSMNHDLRYVDDSISHVFNILPAHQQQLISTSYSSSTLHACIRDMHDLYLSIHTQEQPAQSLTTASILTLPSFITNCNAFSTIRFMHALSAKLLSVPSSDMTSTTTPAIQRYVLQVINSFLNAMEDMKIQNLPLESLPSSLQSLIDIIIHIAAPYARAEWPSWLLRRMRRDDLVQMNIRSHNNHHHHMITSSYEDHQKADIDGLIALEEESKYRFAEDERMVEVIRLLRSSVPVYLKVDRGAEVSDLEYRRKLQLVLLLLCRRSLSYPIGRGMLTLGSLIPTAAEPLPFPPLMLSGRLSATNSIVALDTTAAPAELTLWPEFHNGVAAGLRIGHYRPENRSKSIGADGVDDKRRGVGVTRNWIVYNRTVSHSLKEDSTHAGLLYALGLRGHLRVLSHSDICDYLTKGHHPTAIAILLGCAASYQSSADPFISKTLCLHLPALLPPRHADIDISPTVQAAALTGLGLLHCRSHHRLMIEFLIAELCKVPTSECCDAREAMVLSAGWSLGMVMLGAGCHQHHNNNQHQHHRNQEESVIKVVDRLQVLIEGGRRPSRESLFPWNSSSYDPRTNTVISKGSRMMEHDEVLNMNATAPGAIITLSLIYIRSNNQEIAQRIALPALAFEVEEIRPDLLLYRAVGRCLILWDHVTPSQIWIRQQIPSVIKRALSSYAQHEKPSHRLLFVDDHDDDHHDNMSHPAYQLSKLSTSSALMAYLSILSGLGLGIALVYAGTDDIQAKELLIVILSHMKILRDAKSSVLTEQPRLDGKLIRPHLEMSISVLAISLACISAGSGDINIMRLLRELRWKIEDVSFGTHMAMSMSLGLLFLGGGRASLRRDDFSIACLLLSFIPRYPNRTIDHQYYLQPLRHLYVLATEHRLLRVEDVDSAEQLRMPIMIELLSGEQKTATSPCLLPELSTVKAVHFIPQPADRYYASTLCISSALDARTSSELPPLLLKSASNHDIQHQVIENQYHDIKIHNPVNTMNDDVEINGTNHHHQAEVEAKELACNLLQRLSYDAICSLSTTSIA